MFVNEYSVESYTGEQYGWEAVYTTDDLAEAEYTLDCYEIEQPNLEHRITSVLVYKEV